MSVMHDLVERPPARFADRGQRTISGIADTEWVRHLVVVGDAQDGAGFILIPLRLTPSAYQQAVGLSKVFFGETALAAGFIDEMDLPETVLSRAEEAALEFTKLNLGAHAASKLRARADALTELRAAIDGVPAEFGAQ